MSENAQNAGLYNKQASYGSLGTSNLKYPQIR